MPLKLRCSELPRVWPCPASAQPPKVKTQSESAPATLGGLVHRALADQDYDPSGDAAMAGIDPTEARMLVRFGKEAYTNVVVPTLAEEFREIQMGSPILPPYIADLSGRPDTFGPKAGEDLTFALFDYKSGRVFRDYSSQMKGYARLIMGKTLAEKVEAHILWLRDGEMDTAVYTRDEISEWQKELVARLESESYTDDVSNCHYCPHQPTCPQFKSLMGASAIAFRPEILPSTIEELAALRPQRDAIMAAMTKYDAACKAGVIAAGKPVPIGNGQELAIQHGTRKDIDVLKAWPVLAAYGDPMQTFGAALEIGNKAAEQIVRAMAARGKKDDAKKDFWKALAEAEAVVTKPVEKLVAQAIKKEDGQ